MAASFYTEIHLAIYPPPDPARKFYTFPFRNRLKRISGFISDFIKKRLAYWEKKGYYNYKTGMCQDICKECYADKA